MLNLFFEYWLCRAHVKGKTCPFLVDDERMRSNGCFDTVGDGKSIQHNVFLSQLKRRMVYKN